MKKSKTFLILHLIIALYSLTGVFTKIAGTFPFLSLKFVLCYGGIIAALGIYAIGWQQIIKKIPLTTAFANKAFTVVWGLIFGVIFFKESVSFGKILGIAMVVFGVILFAGADTGAANNE